MAMRATIVDCCKLDRWSVCILRNMEKPRSESALDTGMDSNPAINLCRSLNVAGHPILPTSDQNRSARGLMVPSELLYFTNKGKSEGEIVKCKNSSLVQSFYLDQSFVDTFTHQVCMTF